MYDEYSALLRSGGKLKRAALVGRFQPSNLVSSKNSLLHVVAYVAALFCYSDSITFLHDFEGFCTHVEPCLLCSCCTRLGDTLIGLANTTIIAHTYY